MTIVQNNTPSSTNFWLERRTIVAYAVSLLALAEIIDLTIVSVAVPHIMGSLNANLSEVSLTMTSYIVAAAVCIPLTGLVTRKFGTKRVILASAVIFMIINRNGHFSFDARGWWRIFTFNCSIVYFA